MSSRASVIVSWFLFAAVFCSACAYRTDSTSMLEEVGDRHYPILVMREPLLQMEHGPPDVYVRTLQMLDNVAVAGSLPVISPWEIEIPEGADWPHGDRHLELLLASSGVDPANVYVLRFAILEEGTQRAVELPFGFGGGVEASFRAEVEVQLIIENLAGTRELARVSVAFDADPFVESADFVEQRPLLRRGIKRAGEELVALFESAFDGPRGGMPDIDVTYNIRQIFHYGGGLGAPLVETMDPIDELDQLVSRYRWYTSVDPDLSMDTARRFEELPPGLLIEGVGGAAEADGLRVGDYVVQINGRSALGEHVLARAFHSGRPGEQVRLEVLRGGETVFVDLQIPEP